MKLTKFEFLRVCSAVRLLFCALFFVLIFQSLSLTQLANAAELRIAYLPQQATLSDVYKPEEHLIDRFTILSKYLNQKISLIPAQFDPQTVINLLNDDTANIIAFYAKSPSRMFQFKYSKNPIISADLLIVADKEKKLFFEDERALNGKSIAIFSGNTLERDLLDEYIVKNNIVMEYRLYDSYEQYVVSDADFHLTNSYYYIDDKKVAVRIGEVELYFATTAKHAALLTILDSAMEKANANDAEALRELNAQYVHKSVQWAYQNLNSEGIRLVDSVKKPFSIGYSEGHCPIIYSDKSGKLTGIAEQVFRLIEQMHPFDHTFLPYVPNTNVNLTQFDILFSVVGDKKAKDEYFDASNPYLNLPMMLFRDSKLAESDVLSFGMLDYSVLDHADIQNQFPRWDMKIFSSVDELFESYQQGQIDAMLLSRSTAEYAFSKFGTSDNQISPTPLNLPLKFYLSKRFPPLALDVFNAFIAGLNPIKMQEVVVATEGAIRGPATAGEFFEKYKIMLVGVVAFGILLLLSIHFLRIHLERRKYDKLSLTDSLTGVNTKEKAFAVMQRTLKKAMLGEYILLCFDVDKSSFLKQMYGSAKADDVMRIVGEYLHKKYVLRHKDACVARYRDDVFLVFTKTLNINEEYDALDDSDELVMEVRDLLTSNYNLTLSCGCYIIDDVTVTVDTILEYSNMARRSAKENSGMSTCFFNEEMRRSLSAQKDIIYKIENGIDNEEFVLNFQPKVRLEDEQICGAEVLVRWYPIDGMVIYPKDFISVFEANAFITQLDLYVFEKTCQFIKMHRDNLKIPALAVNVSGITILYDEIHMHFEQIMQKYDVTTKEIEIEITDSSVVAETEAFSQAMDELVKLGFVMAIDDFGTGVSSLHHLSSMSPQVVKLDKAFLDDKFTTKKGIFLVACVITMLRKLGVQVVAEGIETEKQLAILKKVNCDVAQGYYFYKPTDEEGFIQILKNLDK